MTKLGAFVRSNEQVETADLQLHMMPLSVARPGVVDRFSGYTLCTNQSRPQSRGEIIVTSPKVTVAPSIKPNYLAEQVDRDAMVEVVNPELFRNRG